MVAKLPQRALTLPASNPGLCRHCESSTYLRVGNTMVSISEAMERPSFSSKSPSISGSATLKQGGSRFMNKFFGSKSPLAKGRPIEETSEDHIPAQLLSENFPPGLIKPCPFIRPLEHKLQARSEARAPVPRLKQKARSFDTISTCESSAFHVALDREKTHRILENRDVNVIASNEDDAVADLSTADSITDLKESRYQEMGEGNMDSYISHHLEQVAREAAENPGMTLHWDYYIQCYSKGQFNINHPPESPPRNSKFKYLPAVFPQQEELRVYASQSYDVVWSRWSEGQANALVSAAMKEFDTGFASVSFFDENYEYFKMEHGYNALRISRAVSIAAHALLSADVFVVLDTKQDWRFEGNPLVLNKPNIRFFAGAPMLSPEGHAIGVFAIFGKEPRSIFNATQRRELAGYGAMFLKDLGQQAVWLTDAELYSPRSTPLLERDSVHWPLKRQPPSVGIDQNLVPPGLRYHKMNTPPAETSRVFDSRQLSSSVLSQQTPPSSSEGSENDVFPGIPKGFGKNYKQLLVNSNLNHISSCGDLITPDSEGFQAPTPRPFSASDLTSLNPHPPNTPDVSSQCYPLQDSSELTVENFLALSDNDCAEQESPPLIDLSSSEVHLEKSKREEKQSLVVPRSFKSTSASILSRRSSRFRRGTKSRKEQAAFVCAAFALKFGFDLVYVVEMRPSEPGMTDRQLLAHGGMRMKILVAHNLSKPVMMLDTELHLKVLRGRGWELYENVHADCENGLYRFGCLVPIQTANDSPVSQRSSGVVFAAYRLPTPGQVGTPVESPPPEETQEAFDTALKIRNMILGQSKSRRLSRNFDSEPSSPKIRKANQASELGKHLLDEASDSNYPHETVGEETCSPTVSSRYPAGEAIEVGYFLQDDISNRYLDDEIVEEPEPSMDTELSRDGDAQPKRLTKSSKASSRKTEKAEKLVKPAVEVYTDAAMERPFHSIARFRGF